MKYGLIGEKLGHSFSAEIHPKISNYTYELKEISPKDINDFIINKDFCGINVTIPYKQTVMPFLDFIDDNALKIGAVNTVVNNNGVLYGYNTDFGGLLSLIKKEIGDLRGKKALILGGGATSKTVNAVLKHLNVKEVFTVSRTPDNSQISYFDAVNLHRDANLIVNATPVGMFPNIDSAPISLDGFSSLELVVDVVYNPLRTKLVIEAEKRGVAAQSGLYMLVAQAVLAAEHFNNKKFGTAVIDKIYNELLISKRNIVLIGMPGSGKSTIGLLLAKKLGREFVDTDELIVKKAGKAITTIFNEDGEEYFRQLESEVIASLSAKNGLVIATGGGAILKAENINALKHNGKIFFLDRPLEELLPTDDRPLASTKEQIISRYNERIGLYNAASEYTVNVCGPEETAQKIINNL